MSNTITTEKNTSKKFKAILAGGLVLGIGAAVTMASWTDEEWASASFSSGEFVLESSTDGETFKSHTQVGDGQSSQLQFDLDTEDLGPGQKLAAPFALRLADETTHDAVVKMSGPASDEMGLTYDLEHVDSFDKCTTATQGTTQGTAVGFDLEAGEDTSAGEAEILCFHVEASQDLKQDQSASPTWTFHASLPESAN